MEENQVGSVTHFFPKVSVAIVKLEKPLKVGDTLRVTGAHDEFTFRVDSMEVDHAKIPAAKPGQEVGLKVPSRCHEHSKVFLVGS